MTRPFIWDKSLPSSTRCRHLLAGAAARGWRPKAIAGKPAPTGEWQLFRSQQICRSLACQRCGGPGVCVQSLASQLPQGEWQCTPLFSTQLPQGNGNFSDHNKSVGAWLASDEGDWVSLFNRWQASSHRGSGNFSAHSKSVGAWLASDEGDRVPVFNRWQASSHRGAATFQHTANL